jgi:hypothetical protein
VSFFRILFDILSLVEQKENVHTAIWISVDQWRVEIVLFSKRSLILRRLSEVRLYSKRKVGYGPYCGANYNLPYLIVDSEFQLSIPKMMNADKCFPNYSKMEQSIEKWRIRERGREGLGADFYVLEYTFCIYWAIIVFLRK